ncbi:MAG: N-acetylglucosamine-6-phosphate deacetylase [Capsulimonadaceae bacterium]
MYWIHGDLILPDGVCSGRISIGDSGGIEGVRRDAALPAGRRAADIDAAGFWVLPGFIDMHVHGGGGADFMHGTPEAVRTVARTHARFGTTTLLATTLTASPADTESAIRSIRAVSEAGRKVDESRIAGIHLEGPYICPGRRGAQPLEHVRPPDVDEFERWMVRTPGLIRQITLAPEMPGAEDLVSAAARAGVVISIGHTDATAKQVAAAVGWGARQATHLFNAMRGVHHREPGTAGAALSMPEITAELIADGVHVDPMMVRLAVTAKGPAGIVLITDAIEGAAMPDGDYALGGARVIVRNGVAAFPDGTLAGSVLTMNRAFRNVMDYAVIGPVAASGLASANAARQLGILSRAGTLETGKPADIVILDPMTAEVHWTIIDGKVAYRR